MSLSFGVSRADPRAARPRGAGDTGSRDVPGGQVS